VHVTAAIERHLGRESRQNLVLDAEAELPFGAAFAAALEQRVAVLRAVCRDVRRDALLPASALRRGETDRDASRIQALRVACIPHRILSGQGRTAFTIGV